MSSKSVHEICSDAGEENWRDVVTALWNKALGPAMSPTDGFVAQGGHSLMAVSLVADIQRATGRRLPISALLRDNASLAEVCSLVEAETSVVSPVPSDRVPRRPAKVQRFLPAQEAIWVDQHLQPTKGAYNVVGVLRVAARLDREQLDRALAATVARHDALRAHVEEFASGPALVFSPSSPPGRFVECRAETDQDEQVSRFVEELTATIATDNSPMLRAGMICTPGHTHLVLALHHLIGDAGSLDVLFADLAEAYEAPEEPLHGSPPSASFAAFIEAENRERTTERVRQDVAYWTRHMPAAPQPLPITARTTAPAASQADPAVLTAHAPLDERVVAGLSGALRARGHTMATALLAATAAVLGGVTGEDEIVLGMPVDKRYRAESADLVGLALSVLPLVLPTSSSGSPVDSLVAVRDAQLDASEHDSATLGDLSRGMPRRPGPDAALVQAWVNDLSHRRAPERFAGAPCHYADARFLRPLFPFNVYLNRAEAGLTLTVTTRGRLLQDPCLIDDLAQRIVQTMQRLAGCPPERMRSHTPAEPLASGERPRLAVGDLVTGAPDSPAVLSPSGVLSRRQLTGRTVELSRWLDEHAIATGGTVLIEADRCEAFLPLLIACWQKGVVTGIVDHALPAAVRDARAALLSADARIEVTAIGCKVTAGSEEHRRPSGRMPVGTNHVLFTSGSTGAAKAVPVSSAALFGALEDYLDHFRPTAVDRFALLSGIGHDPALRDCLIPLLCGGTVSVPPQHALTHPRTLFQFVKNARITVLHATPGLLDLLVSGSMGDRLPDLGLVVSGGDSLRMGTVRELKSVSDAVIFNAYGCTESAQIASVHPVDREWARTLPSSERVPIGDRFGRTEVDVLTREGRRALPGELGEVVIRGPHLGIGYGGAETGFLHTGDLGRRDTRGLVHLTGRVDRQLSVDGYRVAPEEIEAAALAHDAVAAAWAGMWAQDGPAVLTLAVRTAPGAAVAALKERLREWLRTRLPRYAVPPRILLVEDFRLSRNHKVIGPGGVLDGDSGRGDDQEAGEVEQIILEVIRRHTGLSLSPAVNFFEGGLTSLHLLNVHPVLESRLGVSFPVVDMFTHVNAAELAVAMTHGIRNVHDKERREPRRRKPHLPAHSRQHLYEELER
ncbi:AMP-binding protein [Streptomyces sp. IBSBF 2953]|nr:AMP-binding protein [Streptomyces hayashii]